MPDDYETDDEPQDSPAIKQMRQEIKNLQKQLKEREDLSPTVEQLKRENLVLKTDDLRKLTEDQREMLFSAFKGVEVTPEILLEKARSVGWVQPPEPEVPAEELAAHARMADASAGAAPVSPDKAARVLSTNNEAEFWALAEAGGFTDT